MKRFDIHNWQNKYLIKEQTTYGDLQKSFNKDISSFTQDLERYLDEPKVKAVLDAGLADGDPNDDKIAYTTRPVAVKKLTPTQNIIGFDDSVQEGPLEDKYGTLDTAFTSTPDVGGPIVTYAGKYIIDGHHRWSATFAVNPGANMDAIDIKPKPGFQPVDILKAVHTSIALNQDRVPRSSASAINLLNGVTYEGVLGKVEKYLTPKAAAIWAENGITGNESIAKHLHKNLELIVDRGHISDAPDRIDMPQSDSAGRGTEIDRIKDLSTGKINIAPPFKPITKENKMKNTKLHEVKNIISNLIKEQQKDDRFNKSTKTIAGLADLFLDTSKKLRKGEFKGIQSGEIDEIDDLFNMILTAAEETNITAVIQRLEGMLGKQIKSEPMGVDLSDEPVSSKFSEPMADVDDEII